MKTRISVSRQEMKDQGSLKLDPSNEKVLTENLIFLGRRLFAKTGESAQRRGD